MTRTRTAAPVTDSALTPASPRELLAVLRAATLPEPRRDLGHVLHWSAWRRDHQHQSAQTHRLWNNITAEATG